MHLIFDVFRVFSGLKIAEGSMRFYGGRRCPGRSKGRVQDKFFAIEAVIVVVVVVAVAVVVVVGMKRAKFR